MSRPFISYAREDVRVAERLEADLRRLGADPWLDVRRLRGGEAWKPAIQRALRSSTHVVVLLSSRSVNKTGYVQNELRSALDLLDSVPPQMIFLVPVRLDNARPQHDRLADLHWIDLFPRYDNGLRLLAESLNLFVPADFDVVSREPLHSRVESFVVSKARAVRNAVGRWVCWQWYSVSVNDRLACYSELTARLNEARVPISSRFGSQKHIAAPVNNVVAFGSGVAWTAIRHICELLDELGDWYVQIARSGLRASKIYLGAYGYGGDVVVKLTSALQDRMQQPRFTRDAFEQWITENGEILAVDYPEEK